jgi:hypothetical protein
VNFVLRKIVGAGLDLEVYRQAPGDFYPANNKLPSFLVISSINSEEDVL